MKYKIITTPIQNSDIYADEDDSLMASELDWQRRVAQKREMKRRHAFNRMMRGQ